jgi:hypothetical protein
MVPEPNLSSNCTVNGPNKEGLPHSAQVGHGPSKPTNALVPQPLRLGREVQEVEEDIPSLQVPLKWPLGVLSRRQRARFPMRRLGNLMPGNVSWLKQAAPPWVA